MADKYQDLLIEWCDALVAAQITDRENDFFGSFRCESCGFPHGRADNAVYPFVYTFILTGKEKYLTAAEGVLAFRQQLEQPSGAMRNDFTSAWEGITAFSAIGLLKTLLYCGDKIPTKLREEIERCAIASARWVHENMVLGFPAYINYYCAAALTNALYAALYHDEAYTIRARELLAYCMTLFTENSLLSGEGKPHDDRSPKGCLPIDIGYIAEESMPCLLHCAELLRDESALEALTTHALQQLDFLLPDGGWDNSFGVRNNKWTYYGSRTSDGCIGAFAFLSARSPLFAEAAERTYEILRHCTFDGVLYGGPDYRKIGQPPCIHHTFCHAGALTDAIRIGIHSPLNRIPLPAETQRIGYKYYPELDSYLIRAGRYRATLTGYDYTTHHFTNGAAHGGGGMLSLLHKAGVGAMIAGSVYEYRQTEPNNMQTPTGERRHASLLARSEYEETGIIYATCLDRDPLITVSADEGGITAAVETHFLSVNAQKAEGRARIASFLYRFEPEGVTIRLKKISENVHFVLPIVDGKGEIVTKNRFAASPIFFLPGGFAAKEYTFPCEEDITILIK